MRLRFRRLGRASALAVCLATALVPTALASPTQTSMFVDSGRLLADPAGTLNRLRLLGVSSVRLYMPWSALAPHARSYRRPRHFHAADPASYASAAWAPWDSVIRQAAADHIQVNLDIGGGAPLWATGRGAPTNKAYPNWEPSAGEFGAFVHAVAVRYSGSYRGLPAVGFWSIWNEPNYGPSLAPQGLPGRLRVEHSPLEYRRLLDAAWSALRRTGHGGDTIVFGDVAPHGYNPFGYFRMMKPLVFLRALYCVDHRYRPLRGAAAAQRGCPATAAGAHRFRRAHPALFAASGFADHPYSRWFPPNVERPNDPAYASLADIGGLERALDRLQRAYGSHRRLPIWNTEYGYITSPPKRSTRTAPYVSQSTAAAYLNEAEYMSWRDPRLFSFSQYLLADPEPARRSNGYGGYASGLLSYSLRAKATYAAWRLPLYLPHSATRDGRSLEVWGCARPAVSALADGSSDPGSLTIQFEPSRGGGFSALATVTLGNPHGYFEAPVIFPSSGTVRLAYTYPAADPLLAPGTTVYSRSVAVKVR